MTDKVIARAAGSGAASWALGGLFETLVAGVETGGLLGVSLVTQPAAPRPPCTCTAGRPRPGTSWTAR